jgi:hypothetical protein
MDKVKSLFVSRRFWVAVAALGNTVANPFGLDPALVEQSILLASVWIVGDSLNKTE